MPSYHVRIATIAASTDEKWIDNLLSKHEVPGVERARQGVERRISHQGLRHIVLIRRLTKSAGVPTSRAVALASRVLATDNGCIALADAVARDRSTPCGRRRDGRAAEAGAARVEARRALILKKQWGVSSETPHFRPSR